MEAIHHHSQIMALPLRRTTDLHKAILLNNSIRESCRDWLHHSHIQMLSTIAVLKATQVILRHRHNLAMATVNHRHPEGAISRYTRLQVHLTTTAKSIIGTTDRRVWIWPSSKWWTPVRRTAR